MAEIHYLISDASKKVDVEAHVLRYWEEELELPIPRNDMGHRYYTDFHIRLFKQVKVLKEKGYQLKAIKTALAKSLQDGKVIIPSEVLEEDVIADDASANLQKIRRSIQSFDGKIHSALNSMVNGSMRNYLQDAIVTMRGDRYCLPVKAEYRSQVKGMIHDQSSTGSTLFIEPMTVVKLNNDLMELHAKEQEEIQVILSTLSSMAAEHCEELRVDYEVLTTLDFIFARGSLAVDQNASRPVLNQEGRIYIREGRHPLLDRTKVVPTTICLGDDYDLLIVTGPNTGGKTVSLKTTGLFTLMGQAGLHIPALDRSELAVFTEVYADIGDEQSIEQSLSTFSSHMTNIVSFLKQVDEHSLVLFDELGAGTDPTEGAALAIAILTSLHRRGIRTMATTHYSELKVFALTTEGVENASCEFDVETLRPTYHLLIGIPGKSNAFAISKKLGLSDEIIEEAKTHLSDQEESFEELLSDLEHSRRTIEREQAEIRAYKEELETLRRRTKEKQEKLDAQKERIIRDANEKAERILQSAKDYADETMRNFRKFGKENISASEMEKEREKLRQRMAKTSSKVTLEKAQPKKAYKPSDFKLGTSVRVLSMNLTGPHAAGFQGERRGTDGNSTLQSPDHGPGYHRGNGFLYFKADQAHLFW